MVRWRRSKHEKIRSLLSPYLDGEVTDREREAVDRHLRTCSRCASELESLRWTVGLVAELPPEPLPRSFVLRQTDVKPASSAMRLPRLYPLLRGATLVTALLLVVVLTLDFGFGRTFAPVRAPSQQRLEVARTTPEGEAAIEKGVQTKPAEKPAAGNQQPLARPSGVATKKLPFAPATAGEQPAPTEPAISLQEAAPSTPVGPPATATPPSPNLARVPEATALPEQPLATSSARNLWRAVEIGLALLLVALLSAGWWFRGRV